MSKTIRTSNNLTIDAAGDVIIDADNADIKLQDGGTEFGRISRVTSDLVIKSMGTNNDILLKGLDGASTITALQLDMSENGNAIFSGNITATDITANSLTTNVISSNGSNADISIQPSGTGDVLLGAIRVNGTTLDSSDSTLININEGLVVDGTGNFSGTLTTADITNTNNITTTQLDADGVRIKDNLITTINSNANLEVAASGSGVVDVKSAMTTAALTTVGTHTVTGQADIEGVTIKDNTISSNASNSNLQISANGTGQVEVEGVSFFGTTLTAADSSTININEGLVVDGTASVSGTLGVSGVTTLTTTNIDNLTIQDANITSSSNSNINITPGGTGSVIAAGLTLKGTTISAADSSTVNINEGLTVDGTLTSRGNVFGVQTLTGSGSTEVINLTDTVTLLITTGGSQAFSLADGVEGQIKIISMKTDGGSGIVTPANFVNGTTITFDDVEDTVTLLYQSTGWVALARQNATFG